MIKYEGHVTVDLHIYTFKEKEKENTTKLNQISGFFLFNNNLIIINLFYNI